jgi:mutator protein MutT
MESFGELKKDKAAIAMLVKGLGKEGFYLYMQVRQGSDDLAGYKEFPGGKIEPFETEAEAAKRELFEEASFEIPVKNFAKFNNYTYEYSDRSVELFSFLVESPKMDEVTGGNWDWIDFKDPLKDLKGKILKANELIIRDLAVCLSSRDN